MAEPETMSGAIFLAGGTGPLGIQIARKLYASNKRFTMLVRDVARAKQVIRDAGVPEDSVEFVKGDVTDVESVRNAFKNKKISSVVSSIGSTTQFEKIDHLGNVALIDAAKENGVDNFVLISSTSVTKTWTLLNLVGLAKPKLKAENHLRASGLLHAIIRPPGMKNSPGGSSPVEVTQGDTLSLFSSINREDVADVVVTALDALNSDLKHQIGRGWTFEVGLTSKIPTSYTGASLFAQSGSDVAGWRAIFSKLKPDQ